MNLLRTIALLETDESTHLARLLILINEFSEDQTGIEGLTKLAKLDFLLRYPVMLERALEYKHKSTKALGIQDYERHSVESRMVRYRYGPWDHRYRNFINGLIAKGLIRCYKGQRTVGFIVTDTGKEHVKCLVSSGNFEDILQRSKIVKQAFDMKGTNLMKLVYAVFPELYEMKLNQPI